ncbi:hypothetical protein NL676_030038, partial [Syzygium grande]
MKLGICGRAKACSGTSVSSMVLLVVLMDRHPGALQMESRQRFRLGRDRASFEGNFWEP